MSLGKDSRKIQVVVSKRDSDAIGKTAELENRSVSNWVYTLIKRELDKNGKKR